MCGIVGYIGYRNATDVCKEGLISLEYRGYDSFGIASISESTLSIYKDVGKVSDHASSIKQKGMIGIGHTRWATHGVPSKTNAHPITDCRNHIAVVHNGIIENYAQLKRELEERGHVFRTETDTEVIPHLLEEVYDGTDLCLAMKQVIQRLKGSYAILAVAVNSNMIVAARNGSPLVLGLGNNEVLFASDVIPIIEYTRHVIYLEDGDIASVSGTDMVSPVVYHEGKQIKRDLHTVSFDVETARKGCFPHYMLKEIYEQPYVFKQTVSAVYDSESEIPELITASHSIVVTACGTSAHASMVLVNLLNSCCNISAVSAIASEFKYMPFLWADLVIGVSQSGETADTLSALKIANEFGAKTVGITNVLGSSITRVANHIITTKGGPEISVAATKTFIAQTAAFMALVNRISDGKLSQSIAEIQRYLSYVLNLDVSKAVSLLKKATSIIYVGRGLGYPIALEGALKMKEISYIHAEGYAAGEVKHGPFALLSSEVPVVAACFTSMKTYSVMMSNLKEIKARNSPLVIIGTDGDKDAEDLADVFIALPNMTEVASHILSSTVEQFLAYYTASALGRDIDCPKNLAKSVTVE